MSAFNTDTKDAEYPFINVDSENEHFELGDSLISWMEEYQTIGQDKNPVENESLISQDQSDSSYLFQKYLLSNSTNYHELSAPGVAWNLVRIFLKKHGKADKLPHLISPHNNLNDNQVATSNEDSNPDQPDVMNFQDAKELHDSNQDSSREGTPDGEEGNSNVRMRGNDEWAPPRAQIIFNVHENVNFRKTMQRQNYRCAGCGTKIDLEMARRLVLLCHYLGKYFCKCCYSHKSIHLPGYILQKWDFHKYSVSHFALQLLDRMADEPLFNINDINPLLYRKVKKLRHLVELRMQLYYLRVYITTCAETEKLQGEFKTFTHQHLLQNDVHLYSLNNLIEIQHGKLYEYLNDLVSRSIAHVAQCDSCQTKGQQSGHFGSDQNTKEKLRQLGAQLRHSNSIGQELAGPMTTSESFCLPSGQQETPGKPPRSCQQL